MNDTVEKTLPVKTFGVSGQEFEVTCPFLAGHVLTENEAAVMNQTYIENIRNNTREKVKTWVEEGKTVAEMQDLIDEIADEYKFGERKGGGKRVHDPILREMRALADEALKPIVAKQGGAWTNLSPAEKENLRERYLAKFGESLKEIAVTRIEAAKKVTSGDFDINA